MSEERGGTIWFAGDDESAYAAWMARHYAEGYVAAVGKQGTGRARLHGGDCVHVSWEGLATTRTARHPKACALDRTALEAEVGREYAVEACLRCHGEPKANRRA